MRELALAVPSALAKALIVAPRLMKVAIYDANIAQTEIPQRCCRAPNALIPASLVPEANGLRIGNQDVKETCSDDGCGMAMGMLRRGLRVSSPRVAAPSKPAKERKPKTAGRQCC